MTRDSSSRLLCLDVFLCPDKDIPHLGDVLHQIFVKRDGDLQPTYEGGSSYVLITVAYLGHLALEVVDAVLQILPGFHLDRKEMVVIPLKFPPRSKPIVECIGHIMKIPE